MVLNKTQRGRGKGMSLRIRTSAYRALLLSLGVLLLSAAASLLPGSTARASETITAQEMMGFAKELSPSYRTNGIRGIVSPKLRELSVQPSDPWQRSSGANARPDRAKPG